MWLFPRNKNLLRLNKGKLYKKRQECVVLAMVLLVMRRNGYGKWCSVRASDEGVMEESQEGRKEKKRRRGKEDEKM
jgi:hypothetical protein